MANAELIWPQIPECACRPNAGIAVDYVLECWVRLIHDNQNVTKYLQSEMHRENSYSVTKL